MIDIVEGSARDVAAIMPVMQDAFDPVYGEGWTASQCLAAITMPDSRLIMALAEGKTVGFAITRWVFDEEELLMIGICHSYQKRGIASLLLEEIICKTKKHGRKKIFLEVRDGNEAKNFYIRKGFFEIGRRKNYYRGINGVFYDAITMINSF